MMTLSRALGPTWLAAFLLLGGAGCSGGSSESSSAANPGDDDDDGSTPTPGSQMVCSVIFANQSSKTTYDLYQVDLEAAQWTGGRHTFGTGAAGFYVLGLTQSQDFTSAGMTDAGSFTLTAEGTDIGDAVSFSDAGGHTYYDATELLQGGSSLGSETGAGGSGSFEGEVTDLNSQEATMGAGSVSVTIDGVNKTFGGATGLALSGCTEMSGFAPESMLSRALRLLPALVAP